MGFPISREKNPNSLEKSPIRFSSINLTKKNEKIPKMEKSLKIKKTSKKSTKKSRPKAISGSITPFLTCLKNIIFANRRNLPYLSLFPFSCYINSKNMKWPKCHKKSFSARANLSHQKKTILK